MHMKCDRVGPVIVLCPPVRTRWHELSPSSGQAKPPAGWTGSPMVNFFSNVVPYSPRVRSL